MTNNNGDKQQRQLHHHQLDDMPRCHVTSTANQMTYHVSTAGQTTYHITNTSTNQTQDGMMTGPGKEVMNWESQCRPIAGQRRHMRAQTTAFLLFGPSFSFFCN